MSFENQKFDNMTFEKALPSAFLGDRNAGILTNASAVLA
jgi:hypothetical protein